MPKLNKAHYNGKGYRQFLEAIKTPKVIAVFILVMIVLES